ncbi:MAG: hypothetical protein WCZ66_09225 [Sphingomonadaceae bacterium]
MIIRGLRGVHANGVTHYGILNGPQSGPTQLRRIAVYDSNRPYTSQGRTGGGDRLDLTMDHCIGDLPPGGYSIIEPFGERRADQRAWLNVALHSNINRDPKKGQPVDLSAILPEWTPPVEPMTQEEIWLAFDRQMRAMAT